VEYDEFAKVIIGPMNKYRTNFVEKAYDKLDIHQQGLIDVSSDSLKSLDGLYLFKV
jgi:hypothetical protein